MTSPTPSTCPVLVVIPATFDGSLDLAAAELLGAASQIGQPVCLTTTAEHVEQLGNLGATRILLAPEAGSEHAGSVEAVEVAFNLTSPCAVVFAHSVRGRDVAARFAARRRKALLTDVVGLRRDTESVVTDHSNFGGAFNSVAAATHSAPVVTIRPGAIDSRAEPATPTVETLEIPAPINRMARVVKVSPIERTSPRPELATAETVVAGGVSLGSEESFEELVGGLADSLGAAVGATRSAVDEGYVSYEAQIGQTGVLVSPKLYIGVGISGAIQHLVGMQTAETIVAINNDADAPIFDIADFGIVGDIFDVVPQILDALSARRT